MAGLSERMISALCVNNTLTSLKLARNGLRKLICVLSQNNKILLLKQETTMTNVQHSTSVSEDQLFCSSSQAYMLLRAAVFQFKQN